MLIASNLLLLAACLLFALRMRSYRRKMRRALADFPGRIESVAPAQFDPLFADDDFGPTPAAEVQFIGCSEKTVASVSDREAWILGVLAKNSPRIFEFGTASGRTTYLLARNQPADGRVVTITLSPAEIADYQAAAGDAPEAARHARDESRFSRFRYSGTAVETRITQLYGDSKRFDETPHLASYDLIFVDGSHADSYVDSDSTKALRMIRPGGTVVWHDYRFPNQKETAGVCRVLDRLAQRLPLRRLSRSSLVVYRAPPEAPTLVASR